MTENCPNHTNTPVKCFKPAAHSGPCDFWGQSLRNRHPARREDVEEMIEAAKEAVARLEHDRVCATHGGFVHYPCDCARKRLREALARVKEQA